MGSDSENNPIVVVVVIVPLKDNKIATERQKDNKIATKRLRRNFPRNPIFSTQTFLH